MEFNKSYKLHLADKEESHNVTVKVTTFPNGYKIARLLIDRQQCWAMFDLVSWKLMSDYSISKILKIKLLRHLRNNGGLKLAHRSKAKPTAS
jgi:hypothetical protein